jgi:VWFA-related protein
VNTVQVTKSTLALALAASSIWMQCASAQASDDSAPQTQVQVPNRPSTALFQGAQGEQRTAIHFDPTTQVVTIKMLVQDPRGYFIPNIRRENFAVYENGVRQENASVEIEHAAVSLGVLLEYGGRYQALNESVGEADSAVANQLLGEIGANDKVAIWTYGDKVEEIAGFSDGRDALNSVVLKLRTPPFSEQNFYDALIAVLTRMHPLSGRKALLLVSSALDTFSKANYRDALQAVGKSDTPIYAISLGPLLQQHASVSLDAGPYAHIDWKGAESKLRQIAAASGGRMYSPEAIVDLPAIFDDLMENLRVRYVITYRSTSDPNVNRARTVRVELVDSRTSGPLRIVDASGKTVHSKIIIKDNYIPRETAAPGSSN